MFIIKTFVFIGISGQQTNMNKTKQEERFIKWSETKKKINFLFLHKSSAAMEKKKTMIQKIT